MEDNMKINDNDLLSSSLQNIARTGAGNNSARPASSGAAGGAPSDAVDLNSYSRMISDGSAAGESARSGRIDQLRQLYVNGQNSVGSQELSSSIIDAHLSGG
jgi:anti-sigma28 factor (negative regulator of flagellin synthesis)